MNKNGKLSGVVINGIRTDLPTHAADYGLHKYQVLKTADQVVTNSATLVDDLKLLVPVGANEVWGFSLYLLWDSGTTPDFDFAWAIPSGASGWHSGGGAYQAGLATEITLAGQGTGTPGYPNITGMIAVGATAGNLQLQWAQNVANASDTTVFTNSYILAHKLN